MIRRFGGNTKFELGGKNYYILTSPQEFGGLGIDYAAKCSIHADPADLFASITHDAKQNNLVLTRVFIVSSKKFQKVLVPIECAILRKLLKIQLERHTSLFDKLGIPTSKPSFRWKRGKLSFREMFLKLTMQSSNRSVAL